MKTSYFGRINSAEFKDANLNTVCIARGHRYYFGRCYPPLYPTWEMIKNGYEYEEYYEKVLSKLNPYQVVDDLGEDAVILCHEKYADIESGKVNCHRHMVARWLEEELGIEVQELVSMKEELKKLKKSGKRKTEFEEEEQLSFTREELAWLNDEDEE